MVIWNRICNYHREVISQCYANANILILGCWEEAISNGCTMNEFPAISSFLILGDEIVFVPLPNRSGIEGSQDWLFDQMGIASSLR